MSYEVGSAAGRPAIRPISVGRKLAFTERLLIHDRLVIAREGPQTPETVVTQEGAALGILAGPFRARESTPERPIALSQPAPVRHSDGGIECGMNTSHAGACAVSFTIATGGRA